MMTKREHKFWTDQPGLIVRMAAQRPKLWAAIGAGIPWLESGGFHIDFFRSPVWPPLIGDNIGPVVLLTSTIFTAATFVFLQYFFSVGDAERHRAFLLRPGVRARFSVAAWANIANLAAAVGMEATQQMFWHRGPWAHTIEVFGLIDLPIDAFWWPLAFVSFAGLTVWGLAAAWRVIRDEALDIAKKAGGDEPPHSSAEGGQS